MTSTFVVLVGLRSQPTADDGDMFPTWSVYSRPEPRNKRASAYVATMMVTGLPGADRFA
jgi:hypothetical protein